MQCNLNSLNRENFLNNCQVLSSKVHDRAVDNYPARSSDMQKKALRLALNVAITGMEMTAIGTIAGIGQALVNTPYHWAAHLIANKDAWIFQSPLKSNALFWALLVPSFKVTDLIVKKIVQLYPEEHVPKLSATIRRIQSHSISNTFLRNLPLVGVFLVNASLYNAVAPNHWPRSEITSIHCLAGLTGLVGLSEVITRVSAAAMSEDHSKEIRSSQP